MWVNLYIHDSNFKTFYLSFATVTQIPALVTFDSHGNV